MLLSRFVVMPGQRVESAGKDSIHFGDRLDRALFNAQAQRFQLEGRFVSASRVSSVAVSAVLRSIFAALRIWPVEVGTSTSIKARRAALNGLLGSADSICS